MKTKIIQKTILKKKQQKRTRLAHKIIFLGNISTTTIV
jgi:hypothetical protein